MDMHVNVKSNGIDPFKWHETIIAARKLSVTLAICMHICITCSMMFQHTWKGLNMQTYGKWGTALLSVALRQQQVPLLEIPPWILPEKYHTQI